MVGIQVRIFKSPFKKEHFTRLEFWQRTPSIDVVWDNLTDELNKGIEYVQNEAARIVAGATNCVILTNTSVNFGGNR
jgi:hypothetical protein